MSSKTSVADVEAHEEEEEQPLLPRNPSGNSSNDDSEQMTFVQIAISRTFKSTAHLANLLPTGTTLAFQLLSPVFTAGGRCEPADRAMTAVLLALCGLSCFLLSFTDSFRDGDGRVRYGVATCGGLWVIDGPAELPAAEAAGYRIRFIDFVHAVMSVMVFAAVALFDQNVVACFVPVPSEAAQQVVTCLPVGIGVVCSMMFVTFPTTRHGIGFPLSPQ